MKKVLKNIFWGATAMMLSMPAMSAPGGLDLNDTGKKGITLMQTLGNVVIWGVMLGGAFFLATGLFKLAKNSQQDTMQDKIMPLFIGVLMLAVGGLVGIASGTFGVSQDTSQATGIFK